MSIIHRFIFLFASFLFAAHSICFAGNGGRIPAAHFVGVRPAALGEAFTAVADDQNALYYNPAGLARQNNFSLEILSLYSGTNVNLLKNVDAFKSLGTASSSGSSGNTEALVENIKPILKSISGESNYIRVGWNPTFLIKKMGFGFYANNEIEIVPHGNALPSILDFSNQLDVDLRSGFAFSFLDGKLAWGISAAAHSRALVILDQVGLFDLSELAKDKEKAKVYLKNSARLGWGAAVDTGFLFTPVEAGSPTLGLAVLNMGDTKFYKIKSKKTIYDAGTPEPIPQSVNVGVSVKPSFGPFFVRPSMDFRDINLPTPASQKLSLGLEGGFKGSWISAALQSGFSEGYISSGLEIKLLILNIRYANYVTERGYFPSQSPQRKHLLGIKLFM